MTRVCKEEIPNVEFSARTGPTRRSQQIENEVEALAQRLRSEGSGGPRSFSCGEARLFAVVECRTIVLHSANMQNMLLMGRTSGEGTAKVFHKHSGRPGP